MLPRRPRPTLFPYTTLFRSDPVSMPRSTPDFHRVGDSASSTSEGRSEEHTSELQSQFQLVCRLLLEKKNHADSRACEREPGLSDGHAAWVARRDRGSGICAG